MSLPYILTDSVGTKAYLLNATAFVPDHATSFGWGMQQLPRAHGGRAVDTAYLNPRAITLRGYVGAGSAGGSLPISALTAFSYTGPGTAGNIKFTASTKTIAAAGADFTRLQIGQSITVAFAMQAGNNGAKTIATVTPTALTIAETLVDEDSSVAQISASMLPTIEVLYLSQLHEMSAFFCANRRGILDYRNGWLQYVLVSQIRFPAAEGWPTDRAFEVDLLCEDPMGYGIALLTAAIINSGGLLSLPVAGNAPSLNYHLSLRSNTTDEQAVTLYQSNVGSMTRLQLPASTAQPLVLHGWQRVLYQGALTSPAWSRLLAPLASQGPNVFPVLQPNVTNAFTVLGGAAGSTPLVITDLAGTNGSADVQAQLTAHSAVWLPESLQAAANLPAGMYDLSAYDVATYS